VFSQQLFVKNFFVEYNENVTRLSSRYWITNAHMDNTGTDMISTWALFYFIKNA